MLRPVLRAHGRQQRVHAVERARRGRGGHPVEVRRVDVGERAPPHIHAGAVNQNVTRAGVRRRPRDPLGHVRAASTTRLPSRVKARPMPSPMPDPPPPPLLSVSVSMMKRRDGRLAGGFRTWAKCLGHAGFCAAFLSAGENICPGSHAPAPPPPAPRPAHHEPCRRRARSVRLSPRDHGQASWQDQSRCMNE